MFCAKCGKELPNGASFCPNCGNQTDPSKKKETSLKNPFLPILAFFKKGNQAQAIADTYQDKSAIGIIIATVSALLFALSYMVCFLETTQKQFRAEYGGTLASFFLALLAGVMVVCAGVFCVFLYAKLVRHEKEASFLSAVNLTAYAFLPLLGASLLNMLLGLITYAIPVIFWVMALAVSLAIYLAGFRKVFALGEDHFAAVFTVVTVIVAVAAIFFFIAVAGGATSLHLSILFKIV